MHPAMHKNRWHRADLYVTPLACFVLVTVFGALLIIGAVTSS